MHMSGSSADKWAEASFISQPRPREANGSVRSSDETHIILLETWFFARYRNESPAISRRSLISVLNLDPNGNNPRRDNYPRFQHSKDSNRRPKRSFENKIEAARARSGRVNRTSTNNQRFTRKRRHAGANSSIYRYYIKTDRDRQVRRETITSRSPSLPISTGILHDCPAAPNPVWSLFRTRRLSRRF